MGVKRLGGQTRRKHKCGIKWVALTLSCTTTFIDRVLRRASGKDFLCYYCRSLGEERIVASSSAFVLRASFVSSTRINNISQRGRRRLCDLIGRGRMM